MKLQVALMPYKDRNKHLEACRRRYQANKEAVLASSKIRKNEQIEMNRFWVHEYLLAHPCIDCGEADPVVLEFDHVDPSQKKSIVSRLVAGGYSIRRIQKEILLCEVRCANCHKRRTAVQQNWRILDYQNGRAES